MWRWKKKSLHPGKWYNSFQLLCLQFLYCSLFQKAFFATFLIQNYTGWAISMENIENQRNLQLRQTQITQIVFVPLGRRGPAALPALCLGTASAGQEAQSTPAPYLPLWGEQSCSTVPRLQRGSGRWLCGPAPSAPPRDPLDDCFQQVLFCFDFVYWIITSPTVWGGYSEELLSCKLPCTVFSAVLCH